MSDTEGSEVRAVEMWAVTRDESLQAVYADRAMAEQARAAGMGDRVVPYWWLEMDGAVTCGPGVYGLTGDAAAIVAPGTIIGGNDDGSVALDITDLVGNNSPGWISLHGRVRIEGFDCHRDDTGMLIVRSADAGMMHDPDGKRVSR